MAGCELNIAHAFVAAPAAHRLRHDVIVTSADDFEATRRRRCVEDNEDAEVDRDSMISRYRLMPSAFGPGGGGEWVTLSKSVLLQLVERICQLSFQTDSLAAAAATAACPSASLPFDRLETSAEILMDVGKSTDTSSVAEAERPDCLSPEATSDDVAVPTAAEDVEISNTASGGELTEKCQDDVDGLSTSDKALASDDTDVVPSQEFDVDGATQDANCDDDDDSEVFTSPVEMRDGAETENSSSLVETLQSMSTSSDMAIPNDTVVSDAVLAVTRKPPSPTTSLRSTQPPRSDRRRRLRELRRLRRHRLTAITADNQLHEHCQGRRCDVIVRRRFAVPRQPPPRFHDRHSADGSTTDACSPMRLPVGCHYRRVSQPWSALNKVVICQLIDVVLSQELTSTTTVWQSATGSSDKRRSSGTIWNPAITPETRECRTPTPLQSSPMMPSTERGSSTLLHSLLSPMATYLDRRRSDMLIDNADAGGEFSWTVPHSSSGRRRHHSAAAPDSFHVPWTPPSFFWYHVPPSSANFLLLPDAASRQCYRWISATQPAVLLSTSAAADVCPLDYRAQTLEAGECPDAVDNQAAIAAASVPSRRSSRPSIPASSVASRQGTSARLKWVVVNKTDVCSLFESLASSMVADSDAKRRSEEPSHQPTTDSGTPGSDKGSRAVNTVGSEPIKWKSTLLRRARAEAQTPKRSGNDGDVAEKTHVSFRVDC